MTTAIASASNETNAGPFSYFWNRSIRNPYANCINFIANYANPMIPATSCSSTATSCTESAPNTTLTKVPPSLAPPCSDRLPSSSTIKQSDHQPTISTCHPELDAKPKAAPPRHLMRASTSSSSSSSLPQKELKSPFGLDAIAIEMLVPSAVTPGIITRGQGFKLKAEVRATSSRKLLFQDGPELRSCGPASFTGRLTKMKNSEERRLCLIKAMNQNQDLALS